MGGFLIGGYGAGLSRITPELRYPVLGADDIAGLVSYLVRPESKFLTGKGGRYLVNFVY